MLSISRNNQYFLEESSPFFWLGDTAWLLFSKLNLLEVEVYFRNRKELGFNVIQAILIYDAKNLEIHGDMPYGNKDVYSASYWEFCDQVIDLAKKYGLYLALLPHWGSFVSNGIVTKEQATKYAHFLGQRYQKSDHIIWVLGGDLRGDITPEIHDIYGKILKDYNPKRLMTFHPFGRTSSYLWFHEKPWLDFHMFQSGHRRYDQTKIGSWDDNTKNEDAFGEDNWKYVLKNKSYLPIKPILDSEPSYEGIVQGLHNPNEKYWEAKDVRRYAYWSVFEGACGFTYGNNSIIQFYKSTDATGAYGVRETWLEGLHSEGGTQMQYLKNLMLSVDFINGSSKNDLLLSEQKEKYHRISIFAGQSFIFVYTYLGESFEVSLKDYKLKNMEAYWMNPQNGSMSYIDTFKNVESLKLKPTKRHEDSNDWVLVLKERTSK